MSTDRLSPAAISRALLCLPGRVPDPAFEYPKLVARRQHLGAELGVAVTADDQDLDQESKQVISEQVIEEGVEHKRGAAHLRRTSSPCQRSSVSGLSSNDRQARLTPRRFTPLARPTGLDSS